MKFIAAGLGNRYGYWREIQSAIPEADRLGFWGAVMPDHYVSGDDLVQNASLETWIAISNIAARTSNIRLGTLVTPIPFRPPGILAKMVSTVDVISEGRVMLGVGAGWSQLEFEGYSEWKDPKTRVDMTKEGLALILKLWTEKSPINFDGKFYHAKNAILEPKPVQKPHPTLIFGGKGTRMLRMAGRYGNICYFPDLEKDNFEEERKVVLHQAKRYGREDQIAFAGGIMGTRNSKYETRKWAESVELANKRGCQYMMISFPADGYIASMRDFVSNVMPSYV